MNQVVTVATKPMSRIGRGTYRTLRLTLLAYFKVWHRLKVVGTENVPKEGPFILALGAHRSILDTPIAAMATRRILRYMGAEAYFAIPVFGNFLDLVGGFAVERSMTDRQALRLSEDILTDGSPLVIFPESTRGRGSKMGEVREGTAFIAARTQVPIVPVGIGGTERSLPIGGKVPRPTKLALVVGKPISAPVPPDGGRVKRSQVRELSAELKGVLQDLFDEAQDLT